jgi:uncharacterized protein YjiS (DUF1127 family)
MPCAECLPGTFTSRLERLSPSRSATLAGRIRRAARSVWRSYWRRRAERATLFMLHSLDDRTLKDIGIDRSEIESVTCGPYTRHPGRSDASRRRAALRSGTS